MRAHQLVDRLDHVHGDADRARLVGDRAGDRLADPPGRVGRELVAAPPLELVDRLHQADVALLDQVQELQPAVRVLLGDRDHEAQVRLDQLALRAVGLLARAVVARQRRAQLVARHAVLDLELARLGADPRQLGAHLLQLRASPPRRASASWPRRLRRVESRASSSNSAGARPKGRVSARA